jgi:hypothetical protein
MQSHRIFDDAELSVSTHHARKVAAGRAKKRWQTVKTSKSQLISRITLQKKSKVDSALAHSCTLG